MTKISRIDLLVGLVIVALSTFAITIMNADAPDHLVRGIGCEGHATAVYAAEEDLLPRCVRIEKVR